MQRFLERQSSTANFFFLLLFWREEKGRIIKKLVFIPHEVFYCAIALHCISLRVSSVAKVKMEENNIGK